jgi:hypothetical protein
MKSVVFAFILTLAVAPFSQAYSQLTFCDGGFQNGLNDAQELITSYLEGCAVEVGGTTGGILNGQIIPTGGDPTENDPETGGGTEGGWTAGCLDHLSFYMQEWYDDIRENINNAQSAAEAEYWTCYLGGLQSAASGL